MKVVRYTLAISVCIVILISSFITSIAQSTVDYAIELDLTEAEMNWIATHEKVVIAFDEDYAPYSFKNEDGEFVGIAVDFAKEVFGRAGINYEIFPDGQWSVLYDAAISGEVDVIATLTLRPEREEFFRFTKPYISLAQYVITRETDDEIVSKDDIDGKMIALVEKYSTSDYVLEAYDDIKPVFVDSITEALEAVANNKAQATVVGMGTAQHVIATTGIQGLEFQALYSRNLSDQRYGTRLESEELGSILEKSLGSITDAERVQLYMKWGSAQVAEVESVLQDQQELVLSHEEKDWISEHPIIKVGVDDMRAPIEFLDTDGTYKGISIDYLNMIGEMLGVEFEFSGQRPWQETMTLVQGGELDLLASASKAPTRTNQYLFTESYMNLVNVVFAKDDVSYMTDLSELSGKTIGITRGYAVLERMKAEYPDFIYYEVEDMEQGLKLLSVNEIDVYVDAFLTTANKIQSQGIANIKVIGYTPYVYDISIATSRDNKMLYSLMNKALASISEENRSEIFSKWQKITVENKYNVWSLLRVLVPFVLILGIFVIWTIRLLREISMRKKLALELVEARNQADVANEAKSHFLANMSHEIRTPMNAIVGLNELLGQTTLDYRQKDYVAKINTSTKNLLGVINEVLDISKIEAGKLTIEYTDFSMVELIDDLVSVLGTKCNKKAIELIAFKNDGVPDYLIGDSLRLNQVLLNLLGNAIKFTEKGQVALEISLEKDAGHMVDVLFKVSDSGIGMTDEQVSRLFKAFSQADISTTRKYGGTGLGLTISKDLVDLMGGDIDVSSKLDEGSTFSFLLTFSKSDISHYHEEDLDSISDIKVLVVDDNIITSEVFRNYLSGFTRNVIMAMSGEEALEICSREPFDLIIMDLLMDGMDGFSTWKEIKKVYTNTPLPKIILATVYDRDSLIKRALEYGIDEVVTKPIPRSTLFNSICGLYNKGEVINKKFMKSTLPEGFDGIRGSRILTVDDNDINLLVIGDILRSEGFVVDAVSDGKDAIESVQANEYHLVLMDLHMPIIDGYRATQQIRALGLTDLPIVALSADVVGDTRDAVLKVGMNDYLTKPINRSDLWNIMIKWIDTDKKIVTEVVEVNENNETASLEVSTLLSNIMKSVDVQDGLDRLGGDNKTYVNILGKFSHQLEEGLSKMGGLVNDGSYEIISAICHSLGGVAANIGAHQLGSLLLKTEQLLKADILAADSLMNELNLINKRSNRYQMEYKTLISMMNENISEDSNQTQEKVKYKKAEILSMLNQLQEKIKYGDFLSGELLNQLRLGVSDEKLLGDIDSIAVNLENFDYDQGSETCSLLIASIEAELE